MRGSVRLFRVFGIDVNIHVTFLFLILLVMPGGIKKIVLVLTIFCFVTMHELAHSLVARRFGIKVRAITLLPIGGVASMAKMPDKPIQELAVSLAGPLSNLAVIAVFFYPLKSVLGPQVMFHALSTETWPLTFAYMYWINLILAGFNLLPAFPMDGGRVLRALLATRFGMRKATRIAVAFGHAFAILFAYFGLTRFNIVLIVVAIFIYMAASGEEMQVGITETLKKFKVRDILPDDFLTVTGDATLAKVLELIFHSRQEDFPVMDRTGLVGFITRQDIMAGVHRAGTSLAVRDVMRHTFPRVRDTDSLIKAQDVMQAHTVRALPVMKADKVIGVVTLEDIGRVYAIASERT